MTEEYNKNYATAVRDFQQARIRAMVEEFLARLTGKTVDLLSYDEVREKLKATRSSRRELRDIPLDAIVGSVGRYGDFTRSFHPRREMDKERWAGVEMKMVGQEGLPPIEVYQLGEAYFVIDGNHRVSVARQMEAKYTANGHKVTFYGTRTTKRTDFHGFLSVFNLYPIRALHGPCESVSYSKPFKVLLCDRAKYIGS